MSVMTLPEETIPTTPKEPYVTEKPYRGTEVDSERTPVSSLLTYVKGTPWDVDYYRQLITKDEEASANQYSREAVYQQYQLIRSFELRVTSPLETEFETESGEHTMRGTANVYPAFKPIKGDVFIADLFDGRAALLMITEVQQRTIFQDTTYEVQYEVRSFLSDLLKKELDAKVVARTVFVRDFALNQQNPIVADESYDQLQQLRKGLTTLQKQYEWRLYNQETRTVVVPKQEEGTYDPYLFKFIDYAFPPQLRDPLNPWTRYDVDIDSGFHVKTFWDLLIEADSSFEGSICKEFDVVGTRAFAGAPVLNSIAYSPLRWTVFPKGRNLSGGYLARSSGSVTHKRLDSPYSTTEWEALELQYLVRRNILGGIGDIPVEELVVPLIHPVGIDDYYVLTEYFYQNAQFGQSQLELQARKVIEGKELDNGVLLALLNDTPNWGDLECFYYMPLLSFLIRKAIGGF